MENNMETTIMGYIGIIGFKVSGVKFISLRALDFEEFGV